MNTQNRRNDKMRFTSMLLPMCGLLMLLSGGAWAINKVLIKSVDSAACYHPADAIQVNGKGFGPGSRNKSLVLRKGMEQIQFNVIKQWRDDTIVAKMPEVPTASGTGHYILGIVEKGRWVSNRDVAVSLCRKEKKLREPNIGPSKPTAGLNDVAKDAGQEKKFDENESFAQHPVRDQAGRLTGLGAPPVVELDPQSERGSEKAEPNEVVVVTATMEAARSLARRVNEDGIRVKRRSIYRGLQIVVTILGLPADVSTSDVINKLREADQSLWVDFNHRYQLLESDQRGAAEPKTWAYRMLDWTNARRSCEPPFKLGMIDSGIALGDWLDKMNIRQKSMLSNGVEPAKKDHGTAIASLLLGAPTRGIPGLVPRATLYSAGIFRQRTEKVMDTTAELIIKALNWILESGVEVVNISVGGPRNLPLELAIRRVIERGIIVVSAVGIDKQGKPLYPAAQEGVVAVRAIDANARPLSKEIAGDYIDYSAPGEDLWLLNEKGEGHYQTGSSFAAPMVAASYSLMNKRRSSVDSLRETARDLGEPGKDKIYGWGLPLVLGPCQLM